MIFLLSSARAIDGAPTASAADTIRFSSASGRAAAQLEAHRAAVDRVGLVALYAYRRIGHREGDAWRLYAAPGRSLRGGLGLLQRRLPPVERTREGNGILRWDSGLPLFRFIELILDYARPEPPGAA